MLTLQNLFEDLADGVLANCYMTDEDTGEIKTQHYKKLIRIINLGLLDLHTRFNFKNKYIYLYQQPGVETYYLRSEYIEDIEYMDEDGYLLEEENEPFNDDIVTLVEAWDYSSGVEGDKITIDDNYYKDTGITMIAPDIIKVPILSTGLRIIKIQYKAYPKIKIPTTIEPELIKIYIPGAMKEALYSFVANKIFSAIRSNAGEGVAQGINYLSKYERDCILLKDSGAQVTDKSDSTTKFEDRGWC